MQRRFLKSPEISDYTDYERITWISKRALCVFSKLLKGSLDMGNQEV
jgi:hypothetical protein